MNIKIKRTAFMWNINDVCNVTFDQFDASSLYESIHESSISFSANDMSEFTTCNLIIFLALISPVSCQQRSCVQQHEEARNPALVVSCYPQHDHLPLRVYRHRCVSLTLLKYSNEKAGRPEIMLIRTGCVAFGLVFLRRCLWLSVIRLERKPGCFDVISIWWHCGGHCSSLHHHLCCYLVSNPALLWKVTGFCDL